METLKDKKAICQLIREVLQEKEFNRFLSDLYWDHDYHIGKEERTQNFLQYLDEYLAENLKLSFVDNCREEIKDLVESILIHKISTEEGFRHLLLEMEKRFQDRLENQQKFFTSVYQAQELDLFHLTEEEKNRHYREINQEAQKIIENMSQIYLRQLEEKNKQLEIRLKREFPQKGNFWNLLWMLGITLTLTLGPQMIKSMI